MRKMILPKMVGPLWSICENCDCLFVFDDNDVYEDHYVYCVQCGFKNRIEYEKNYDGVVKND